MGLDLVVCEKGPYGVRRAWGARGMFILYIVGCVAVCCLAYVRAVLVVW